MKALTLHQPWASLVAAGIKTIETRSWGTHYRGPLAIHAGQTHYVGPWAPALLFASDRAEPSGVSGYPDQWPRGAIVAMVELVGCVPTGVLAEYGTIVDVRLDTLATYGGRRWDLTTNEPLGDFGPDRFAWLLDDVRRFDVPQPAKGRQGLWNWEAR